MGFLQKLGLVETQEESVAFDLKDAITEERCAPSVNADINAADGVVDEIYAQNGLDDKSDSIYAVDKLIATLPSEMTTVKKQQTVAGILAVTGKSVAALMLDGNTRTETLEAAKNVTTDRCDAEIDDNKTHIEELKAEIEQCEMLISQATAIKEATCKAVSDEIAFINGLVQFCEGMEGK